MGKYKKIIFVDNSGTTSAVMASELLRKAYDGVSEIADRGLMVAVPEPVNSKVAAVMASDGIDISGKMSKKLEENDITDDALILAMDNITRNALISEYERANTENTFEISSFVSAELEVINPHGGQLTLYGICYESIKNVIEKLVEALEESYE